MDKTVLLTPSLEKYDAFPERVKDRSVSTQKFQGNVHLGTTISDCLNTHLDNIELILTPPPHPRDKYNNVLERVHDSSVSQNCHGYAHLDSTLSINAHLDNTELIPTSSREKDNDCHWFNKVKSVKKSFG